MSRDWLADLVAGCKTNNATVSRGACETARASFNLLTESAVVEFIANGGLEKPQHQNTGPWRNNPNPKTPIDQHEYAFHSGTKHGYVAFLYNPQTGKWLIKSFKLNKNSSPLHFPFANLGELLKKGE